MDGDDLSRLPCRTASSSSSPICRRPLRSIAPGCRCLVLEPAGGLGVLAALESGAAEVTAVVDDALERLAVARWRRSRFTPTAGCSVIYETGSQFTAASVWHRSTSSSSCAHRRLSARHHRRLQPGRNYHLTTESFPDALPAWRPTASWWPLAGCRCRPVNISAWWPAVEALERLGLNAGRSLVAFRGIQHAHIVGRPGGLTTRRVGADPPLYRARAFDLVWAPDVQAAETNRFNRLSESIYYAAVQQLFVANDRNQISSSLPVRHRTRHRRPPLLCSLLQMGAGRRKCWRTLGKTWQPFGGSGVFLLLALLGAGLFLALFSSWRRRVVPARAPCRAAELDLRRRRGWAILACMVLPILLVEIPLIQRWILLLGQPAYALPRW